MRLVSFEQYGRPLIGLREGSDVLPLSAIPAGIPADRPASMPALLALGPDYLAELHDQARDVGPELRLPIAGLRLLPPVPRPGKLICVGLNYAEHAREGGNAVPDYPALFLRGPTSMVGHRQPLLRPRVSPHLDYEGELAFVIGRRARHVSEDRALGHVAGYACCNEGTVRDYQRRTSQWTIGKNFEATGGCGPELVTADELPPGAHGLRIRTRVNQETVQDSSTADMVFGVARLVALLSAAMTLEPGDVVATGTPPGVGYARRPPRWLTPGDLVEVEIEGIGVLANPVEDEPAAGMRHAA